MQSDYEIAETSADHHHHHQPQQHYFMTEHSHSSSPVSPFSSHLPAVPPNYIINNIPSLQINNITLQEHQYYSQSSTTPNFFTPQFFQQWPHRQFQPRLEHQETYDNTRLDHILPAAVNFKLDANHDSLPENDRPCSLDFTTPKFCRQSITQDYSTSKQPFCKDIYVPNADRKNSELCNELEEVHGLTNYNQLTGSCSHSALTSENSLNLDPVLPCCHEEEISHHKKKKKKKKRKRKSSNKELLSSMAGFFESLVEKVMSHQDRVQRGFLESMERIDRVRREREEEWRHQEAQTQNREAIARVHEQALASSREALIVSYLEKITGQTVDLPSRNSNNNMFSLDNMTDISTKSEMIDNRWLRSEVEALISVRSGLESKFREPAGSIKGPIWEEVSALMGSMGYQRSAKRCKEKWENINKYFRKTKNDNVSVTKGTSSASSSSYCSQPLVIDGFGAQRQSYMELLEAFTTRKSPCGLVAKPASSSGKLPDFDGDDFHDKAEFERVDGHDLEKLKNVYDKVFEDEIQEDEEEEDDDLEDEE